MTNENYTSQTFVTPALKFKKGTLRGWGEIEVVGQTKIVPLQICVEWDNQRVLVSYSSELRYPTRA